MKPIITSAELKEILGKENVTILDARTGKDAHQSYLEKHIKGAKYIDLDRDMAQVPENAAFGGRHPLPKIENFAETLRNLGISAHTHVVVYDTSNGANAAARCWWMLKSFGLEKVQVLSGGFGAAVKMGLEVNFGGEWSEKTEISEPENWLLKTSTLEEVEKEIAENTATVMDVRDAYRYNGESEPIDTVAGHIPGAVNFPFSENLDENGEYLSPEILRKKYQEFLKDKPKKLIIHCGSGVTACHTILALASAGFEIPSLYVGSWSEWSRREGKKTARAR